MLRWFFIVSSFVLPLAACSENPIQTIDRSSDCAEICDKYKDCLSSDYNTAACRDKCTDMKDPKGTAKIDRCEACIKENSCSGSVFKCSSDCVGIVP
jgi:hypothetical protein